MEPAPNADPPDYASHQHIITYTVAFGVFGTLDPDNYDYWDPDTYPDWPHTINTDPERIDDVFHGAVNGRGKFFSAKSYQSSDG